MSTVKLALSKMTLPEKIQFGRNVANTMDSVYPLFPNPPWAQGDLLDLCLDVEGKYNQAQAIRAQAKSLTTIQDDGEAELNLALTQTANYVQSISGGNAEIISKSGISVKASPSPVGQLPAPTDLSATASAMEGEVALRWTGVKGAKSYKVETATDITGEGNWQSAASCTKGSCTVKGLTSGEKYWFRVAAVGAAGLGAYSNPATKIVP